MVGAVRIGVLPGSTRLKERLISVISTFEWDIAELDRDTDFWRKPAHYDIAILAVDKVTSATLAWLAQTSSETPTPILVIARSHDPQTIADVLRAGADDYVTDPYASEELAARIENLILRSRGLDTQLEVDIVRLDNARRAIQEGDREASFSEREWSLLTYLLEREGQTVGLAELADAASIPTEAAVVSTISRMRKRLEKSSFHSIVIETVYGRGYMAQAMSRRLCGLHAQRNTRDVGAW